MVRLNLHHDQESQLSGVDDAELLDSQGRLIGRFLSDELYRRMVYDWAKAQVSDEELERRRQTPGGKKLSEIFASLESAS
jgi:hypothetical protein